MMDRRLLVLTALVVAGCRSREEPPPPPVVTTPTPAEHLAGDSLFVANCQPCHGARGVGTDHGPPLLHRIYLPGHHADESFYRAAAMGARAHHWGFGDMPPVAGVTREDVGRIIGYVRWLQLEAGIN